MVMSGQSVHLTIVFSWASLTKSLILTKVWDRDGIKLATQGSASKHVSAVSSDFIWDFGKLPFPTHLGKYIIKIGKIRAKIHEIGKIKAIFGLGMTPIYGLKNGQIKSLVRHVTDCATLAGRYGMQIHFRPHSHLL